MSAGAGASESQAEGVLHYFRKRPVAYPRGRPYHGNDNAHVEQKNYTHVRELLGYERFQDPELVEPINDLYAGPWSLYQNYFRPTMTLKSKTRINSKCRRPYEDPKTPCQRLLESPHVTDEAKEYLRRTSARLNPFHLRNRIDQKLKEAFNIHEKKPW